jgi:Tol biopolymer transport system component
MLTTRDYDNFPVWSPQGDLIGFVRKIGVDFEVFTIRPDETIILDAFR